MRIEPDFFESWSHHEHIDTDRRDDRVGYSKYAGNTDNNYSESETNIVEYIDPNLAYIVPTHTHSDRESDDTHHWRYESYRDTFRDPELDRIDRDEYGTYRPSERMWNHSTMEYMVDIWDESDQIDDDREEDEDKREIVHILICIWIFFGLFFLFYLG